MEFKDWITILIPAGITILGFIINIIITNSNFSKELGNYQGKIKLDNLMICLEEYQAITRNVINNSNLPEDEKEEDMLEQAKLFQKILDLVFLYGSDHACNIAASWQQHNFSIAGNSDPKDAFLSICYSVILSSQICLDTTGRCNKASYYYKMKLTDYEMNKKQLEYTHNSLVRQLGLGARLMF